MQTGQLPTQNAVFVTLSIVTVYRTNSQKWPLDYVGEKNAKNARNRVYNLRGNRA